MKKKEVYVGEPMKTFEKKKKLIREKCCLGASDIDFELFMHVVEKTDLDPLMNQIYAVGRNVNIGGSWKKVFTPQTSIDGLRILAEKTGKYAPGKPPEYFYTDDRELLYCISTVKKQTSDGVWHEVSSQAYWDEYVQKDKNGNSTAFWKRFSHLMLAKCAEALALRKAFPAELSGLYTQEEMSQADKDITIVTIDEEQALNIKDLINGDKDIWGSIKKRFGYESISLIKLDDYDNILTHIQLFKLQKEASNGTS